MKRIYINSTGASHLALSELKEAIVHLFYDVTITETPTDATHTFHFEIKNHTGNTWESNAAQSFHISSNDGKCLTISAGSPIALFWGVCELTAMWGVFHLISGDVYPEKKQKFYLPILEQDFAPRQRIREWRVVSDFLSGGEGRSLEGQLKLLRQLARMKVNGIRLDVFLHTPFLRYSIEDNSVLYEKKGGKLHCKQIFEVRDGSIAAGLTNTTPEYTNPEWDSQDSADEIDRKAHEYLSTIIRTAKYWDMRVSIFFEPFDYPASFAPLLETPTGAEQLGGDRVCEGGDILGAKSLRLIKMVFESVWTQYPEADVYAAATPEHGRNAAGYEHALTWLDARYQICKKYDIEKMLLESDTMQIIPGGEERGRREGKMVLQLITALYHILEQSDLYSKLTGMGKRITINAGVVAPVMLPVYADILQPGMELIAQSYTASRTEKALHAYDTLDASSITMLQALSLSDDNIGSVFQMELRSLSRLLDFNIEHGISGYMTRFWPTGDLDEIGYCLSEASWKDVSMIDVMPTFLNRFFGSQSKNVGYAFSVAEQATLLLDASHISYAFQFNQLMTSKIGINEQLMDDAQYHALLGYAEAEALLLKAASATDITESAKKRLHYLANRMYFSQSLIYQRKYIDLGNAYLQQNQPDQAKVQFDKCLAVIETALQRVASAVWDDNDLASVVIYEHLCINEVNDKLKTIFN